MIGRAFPRLVACAAMMALHSSPTVAQERPSGSFTLTFDHFPNTPLSVTELRARLFGEHKLRPGERTTIHVSGFVEGLADVDRGERSRDAIVRIQEASLEFGGSAADVRLGYSRVVWGRLDEIQPTDVINPLDLARFFFDGRSEARLPVAMARTRVFFGERATIDALLVPDFRPGTFDQLDEETSPFNVQNDPVCLQAGVCQPVATEVREPALTWGNVQGGARVTATVGRLDWAVAYWRGFETFGEYTLQSATAPLQALRTFPRLTMVGGDFETARGRWAFRGEVAAFRSEGFADRVDVGIGFDRRAGEYHVSGTVLVQHEGTRTATSTSLVSSAERTFARERYRTRTFVVYNLKQGAAFARNITSVELRENAVLEGSIGWFIGTPDDPTARDVIARFSDRDFLYARFRVKF